MTDATDNHTLGPEQIESLRVRLLDAVDWDLPRPQAASYGPHEQAFRDGYADACRLFRHAIAAAPLALARADRLERAILDAEASLLGDGSSEEAKRLHHYLAPLWASVTGSEAS
jgi:hypothetical protein